MRDGSKMRVGVDRRPPERLGRWCQPARLWAGRRTWQRPSGETCLQEPKCSRARQEPHQAWRSMTSKTGVPPARVFSGRLQGGTPPSATSSPGDGPGQLLQGTARKGPEVTRWVSTSPPPPTSTSPDAILERNAEGGEIQESKHFTCLKVSLYLNATKIVTSH